MDIRTNTVKHACNLEKQFNVSSSLTLFERLLLGSKMNLQAVSHHSPCTLLPRRSPFDAFGVRGYGSKMQKQVFALFRLAHFY